LGLIHQRYVLELKDSVQKLVAKTELCLARKVIYADLAEKEKHFYKTIFIITLCNFWHSS
jgi:hypothetical protein